MAIINTAEQLAQRALDVNVVDDAQLQGVWSELGSTNAPLDAFQQVLLRRGLLTQYQLERLMRAESRTGFFYGDYKVLYCVGAGTFARVFRAVHRTTGQMYAVKVLRSSLSNPKGMHPKTGKSLKLYIDLFRREGEFGLKLKHPNIVELHEVYSHGATHYIVMDFVEGRNLREFYRANRKFGFVEAAHILEGVMAGLNYALQQHGITHRDLKMSNVLLSSEGEPKLVDFGLAGVEGMEEEAIEGISRRTVLYAGLERATGCRMDDPRSDIYFAGTIFYQMLSGQPALPDVRDRQQAGKALYRDIKPILDIVPGVPLSLAMIVNKALEIEPDKRYQTPSDMLVDLKLSIKRLKEGKESRTAGQELASSEGHDEQGQPRKLMIVESDVKMQDMLRELFKKNGYRVLVLSDPERAIQRFFEDSRAADVILFTTSSNGRAALEAFNRFGQESPIRDTPAVLLLDQNHRHWEEEAETNEHRAVANMPIKMRDLRGILLEVSQKKVS
ncbi:MAG TPA: protein kinase [Lacipirellulaceae bacterium]|nr:protein kinase [Lacipirellulaceae bacterium]